MNDRREPTEPTVDVVEGASGTYSIKVIGFTLGREDAIAILQLANRAVEARHADLLVSVADGRVVKRWLTLKDTLGPRRGSDGPSLGGLRMKQDF